MVKVRKDLTGLSFGRLTVIRQGEDRVSAAGYRSATWVVKCSCGSQEKTILQGSLVCGETTSCGCFRAELVKKSFTKHGKRETREYRSRCHMVNRCLNPNNQDYQYYGERGITVCDRWLESFENFYEDMGECPEGYSLDRIDVNGNYEPSNCRWTDITSQRYNIRKKSNNTSGRTGVNLNKVTGKWTAAISKDKKVYHLGTFLTFEEAVAAREAAELEYYGYNKE